MVETRLEKALDANGLDSYDKSSLLTAFKKYFGGVAGILLMQGALANLSTIRGHARRIHGVARKGRENGQARAVRLVVPCLWLFLTPTPESF